MNKEYIDRKAAVAALIGDETVHIQTLLFAQKRIEALPAADVVEVRRGNPIRHYQRFCNSDGKVIREIFDGWECPFCHSTGVLNYCPNCGANMEEAEE